jgi:hypothetical protein
MNRLSALYAWILVVLTTVPAVGFGFGVEIEGYPFSNYPMFSSTRPVEEVRYYVVAIDSAGVEQFAPSTFWKKGHFNEGWRALSKPGRGDRAAKRALCETVATKVAGSRSKRWKAVTEVEFRRGVFRNDAVFGAEPKRAPDHFKALARCLVQRPDTTTTETAPESP